MQPHPQQPGIKEAFVTTELERRFYLFLIGGGYERLFYLFSENDDNEDNKILRIKLEVEITKQERENQNFANWPDPEYKHMLDFMLSKKIHSKLESADLLNTCPPLKSLIPIYQTLGGNTDFDEALFKTVEDNSWLRAQVTQYVTKSKYSHLFDIKDKTNIRGILSGLGYPTFMWLLPSFLANVLQDTLHDSLKPAYQRVCRFGRYMAGALATLSIQSPLSIGVDKNDKWMLYCLSAINLISLTIIIHMVSEEMKTMVSNQLLSLGNSDENAKRVATLESYSMSGDLLQDILSAEEVIKPHLIESIEFPHFNPKRYLLGYEGNPDKLARIFFQARAYALYRLLFKTGRIHAQETAIFLKKYRVGKSTLFILNEKELGDLMQHMLLLHEYLDSITVVE